MSKIEVWARIGVKMTLDVPDNYTDEDVQKAALEKCRQHNPKKPDFYLQGGSYLPQDNAYSLGEGDIEFVNDIEFDI